MMILKTLIPIVAISSFSMSSQSYATCNVAGASNTIQDPLSNALKQSALCPKNAVELRNLLKQSGAEFFTSMVANRGFHNPGAGSFSFFETVKIPPSGISEGVAKDELFFGHFTAPNGNELTLDQNENASGLMVEAIAWDKTKEVYNFYELIGSPQGSKWFYRGDSKDIWSDVSRLHRKRTPSEPIFGPKLRCSGCHISGGPIMKEIAAPHDSWWSQERPLPLAGRTPDLKTKQVMQTLQNPEDLSGSVVTGLTKLIDGKAFNEKIAASPQVALRPLFCSEEVNLHSSPWPLKSQIGELNVPSGFFVDERLHSISDTSLLKSDYERALGALGSKFPEINSTDADHAWLAPVKATSDRLAITKLVAKGMIEDKFVIAVLAVDMTRPVFSKARCELLQLLPNSWSADWKVEFQQSLAASSLPSAEELLQNWSSPVTDTKDRAARFLDNCSTQLKQGDGVLSLAKYLDQSRKEVFASEISKNPRGQIMEPGFRVVFPDFRNSQEVPWRTTLNDECLPE
jgi:hypothetical protein